MFYRTLTAGAVFLLTSGCATRDDEVNKAWQIEPVFNVQHAFRSSQAYYGLGRYHDGSQAWVKAVDAYRKAIAADGQNIEAYNALGVALARMGRVADAETTLRQAVALAPTLAHVRSNLGYVLMLAGKPLEAITELEAAVRQDGGDITAAVNLKQAQLLAMAPANTLEPRIAQIVESSAQASAVALAGTIVALPLAPMPDLAVVAVPGPAGTRSDAPASAVAVAPIVTPATAQTISTSNTVAALRVFDQPNVPSLQRPAATVQPGPVVPAAPVASLSVSVVPDARPATSPWRAVEKALASTPPPALPSRVPAAVPITAAVVVPATAVTVVMAPAIASAARVAQPAVSAGLAVAGPSFRLEISNGNGITGMAASLGRWLAGHGILGARLTNLLPYTQQQTVVQYRSGHEHAAQRLAQKLPITARLEFTQDLRGDLRVVLGRDWQQLSACLEHDSCPPIQAPVALASSR